MERKEFISKKKKKLRLSHGISENVGNEFTYLFFFPKEW